MQANKTVGHKEPKPEKLKPNPNSAVTITRKKTGRQRRAAQAIEDEEELEREYRLLKKLKRGAINESEFDKLMGLDGFSVGPDRDSGYSGVGSCIGHEKVTQNYKHKANVKASGRKLSEQKRNKHFKTKKRKKLIV